MVKEKSEIDIQLRKILRFYLEYYDTENLHLEADIRREPESIKIKITHFSAWNKERI